VVLLCAFGWSPLGLQYPHSAVDLDWFGSEKRSEKNASTGTRITSIDDLIEKATPWRATGSQRDGKATIDWIVPSKECFDCFCDFDAPVGLNESNHFALSLSVMLDVFGSGAEACVSSQHLDIP
jgi:hypothetical protein